MPAARLRVGSAVARPRPSKESLLGLVLGLSVGLALGYALRRS